MYKKLLSIIGLSICITACDKPVETNTIIKPALVMQIGQQKAMSEGLVLTGEVKTRYESDVGFRIPGKIISRYVEVGQRVKKGQVLATIDSKDANLNALAASADVKAAEANHHLAEVELARKQQLYQQKFISKSALDAQEASFKASLAQLKQTKSQAAVSSNQTAYTRLLADRAGIISQINAEPGQVVSAGQVIAKILDTDYLEVIVPMPESDISKTKIDDKVIVKLWADTSKEYQGKVREISPAANENTRAFDVRVSILDADELVKIGMTAGVKFNIDITDKLIIPSTAVTAVSQQPTVWIVNSKGIAMPRAVQIGNFTEDGVEVISGINKGEMVVIAGTHTLVKGQQVKPIFENNNRRY